MTTDTHERPAAASGTFAIGGDLPVHRLGYGSMQLTGTGVWASRTTGTRRCACSGARWSSG